MKRPLVLAFSLGIFILSASCGGLLGDWQEPGSGERAVIWQTVVGIGNAYLNENPAIFLYDACLMANKDRRYLSIDFPVLAVVNGRLAAAWVESNGITMEARCALFSGDESAPYWMFIDGGLAGDVNVKASYSATSIDLEPYRNKLYAALIENGSGQYYLHARVGY
ncbi:MAG: hypothetical protein JXA20_17420 [Spirochaetes bacterium]|nr:hypothetical protein [Spirochaetota bacterium]